MTVVEGGVLVEVEAAEAEHDEALKAWRELQQREARLQSRNVLKSSADAEDERLAALDDVGVELERQAVADAKPEAARRLADARARLREAQVAAAQAKLPALVEQYEQMAAKMRAAAERAERACLELVEAAWDLAELEHEERRTAAAISSAVEPTLIGDEARDEFRFRIRQDLPTDIDAEGAGAWTERVRPEIFGARFNDPRAFDGLHRIVAAGRDKAIVRFDGLALIKRLARRSATRKAKTTGGS
jgi:hypothetical protein